MTTTYVYNETEVELTGRKAAREIKGTARRKEPIVDELVEITPVDKETGSWKKFVRFKELYEVTTK